MSYYQSQPSYLIPYQVELEEEEEKSNAVWWVSCALLALVGIVGTVFATFCVGILIFSATLSDTQSSTVPTRSSHRTRPPTLAPISLAEAPSLPPPSSSPLPTPQIRMTLLGQRTESNGVALTLNDVLVIEGGEGFDCVTIDVILENLNREAFSYNPLDFKIYAGAESLEQTSACNTNDQPLQAGELAKQNQVQGKISFKKISQTSQTDQENPVYVPLLLIYQELTPAGGHHLIVIDLGPL